MLAHPVLINRPIVATSIGVELCRPSEALLAILPNPHIGPFVKDATDLPIILTRFLTIGRRGGLT